MDLPVGWLYSSSSIRIFSIITSCRNYLQLDVEEWEYLSWTWCTLSRRCVFWWKVWRKVLNLTLNYLDLYIYSPSFMGMRASTALLLLRRQQYNSRRNGFVLLQLCCRFGVKVVGIITFQISLKLFQKDYYRWNYRLANMLAYSFCLTKVDGKHAYYR